MNTALTRYVSKNQEVLNIRDLQDFAPSIFAEHASEGRSTGYKFYSTWALLQALIERGWLPFQAFESRVLESGKQGFQKHMIRLKQENSELANVGDTAFNLVLINSHDGKCSYQLHAGLFRRVCSNGLIVSDQTFEPIRLRHAKLTTDEVIDAQVRVIDEIPRIGDTVREFQSIKLSEPERIEFARAALQLRWDSDEQGNVQAPVKANQLLYPRRWADRENQDLYTTYNVVQENLVRGGLHGRNSNGGRASTRAVTGVDSNVKLNKALWALTEGMAKIKAVAAV